MNGVEPIAFCLNQSLEKCKLLICSFSTAQGLALLEGDAAVRVNNAYFDDSVDSDLQQRVMKCSTVVDLISLLNDSHGLYDFSCEVDGGVSLSTHDDCECHFEFSDESQCKEVVNRLSKEEAVWEALVANPGSYVHQATDEVVVLENFDQWIKFIDG